MIPKMFEFARSEFGDEPEFLHDIHELLPPIEAINLVKELEQYRPFFIEDPLAPEDNGYFKMLREQTSCAIAMGELFNNSHEWVNLITERLIDFIRIHISQIGGITPALKVARLAEWFNVRTACMDREIRLPLVMQAMLISISRSGTSVFKSKPISRRRLWRSFRERRQLKMDTCTLTRLPDSASTSTRNLRPNTRCPKNLGIDRLYGVPMGRSCDLKFVSVFICIDRLGYLEVE